MDRIAYIILLNLIFFFKTLRFGPVSDDLVYVGNEGYKNKSLKTLWRMILGTQYIGSLEIEHLYALVVHIANCILIYYVFGMNDISFMAAMLFSINPANSQSCVWISGKNYRRYLTILLIAYGLNLWLFIIALLAFYYVRLIWLQSKEKLETIPPIAKEISFRRIVIPIKIIGYYLKFSLFPYRLGMYLSFLDDFVIDEERSKEGFKVDKHFLFGIFSIILLILGIIFNPFNLRFGLAWFILCLIPFLQYPRVLTQVVAERYVYIANAGMMLCLATLCNWTAFIIFFTFYLTRFLLHINSYKNDSLYLQYNVYDINYPEAYVAHLIKGRGEQGAGRWCKAVESYLEAIKFAPTDIRANYFYAEILFSINQFKDAIHHLDVCLKNPINIKGDITPAVLVLKQMCEQKLKEVK